MRKVLFILLIPFTAFAQQVVITGKVPDAPDSIDVFVYKPIGTYFNSLYKQSAGKVTNHQFTLTVPMEAPGYITIENKYVKSVLYVEPGDSVDIGISREGSADKKIYSGNNAAGHDLFNNNTPFSPDQLSSAMDHVMDTARSVNGALWGMRSTLFDLKAPLLVHLRKGQVSVGFYESMVTTLESRLIYCLLNSAGKYLEDPANRKNKSLNEKELKQLIQDATDLYDPFDVKYVSSPGVEQLIAKKCYLIKKGYIRGDAAMTDFWRRFDEPYKLYAYAPINLHEMMAGNEFLANIPDRYKGNGTQIELFYYFKTNFPKSAYIPLVQELLSRK
ncbi:hypothetical protein [Chitinophaga ginsengisoli]|uniref:DUF4369 domain-containing protein n=1 Tax=Chitinophaga ginsengisoli TaxID=363837 RepID=A0A2P8FM99_9BACT|nr:hypothetical protein [Chitinophaga ginsengisoli]PSL22854.1 hypothetical protein CLV42_120116 [Chitinophaga ginsengisoli]